jgi:predicted dehydrogenase
VVDVEVPTYITGMMEFAGGAVGTIFTTFDVCAAHLPIIEIYGSHGTLSVPDPNTFGGVVKLYRSESRTWHDMPHLFGYAENMRGIGLADMAKAIQTGRPHRADEQLIFHVLEALTAFVVSAEEGRHVTLTAPFTRTAPMAGAPLPGVLD